VAETDYLHTEIEKFRSTDKRLQRTEVRNRILTMKRRGASFEQIRDVLAASDPPVEMTVDGIRSLVHRYLERVHKEDAETIEQLRAQENERLDDVLRILYPRVIEGDMKAIDRFIRLSERRAKMNGLDAARQIEHRISGMEELGLSKEMLERSEQAFTATYEEDGIADVEIVEEIPQLEPGE
jgi:DNA-binding transcriptional MerR regulator